MPTIPSRPFTHKNFLEPSPRYAPLRRGIALLCALLSVAASGCNDGHVPPNELNIAKAESILDAFYSWNAQPLASLLASAEGTEAMLYYQRWAEAAHYEVELRRPCSQASAATVICAITVTDDFGSTLGYTATDTFTFTFEGEFEGDRATRVDFAGDDPPVTYALWLWVWAYHGNLLENECADMFEGGTTPAECARAFASAAKDFVAWSPFS